MSSMNAAYAKAMAQYGNSSKNKVLAAQPADLTLMLYDGAIKFTELAIMAVDEKNVPDANTNIQKVEKIITYLRETLDLKYQVSQDFENMYVYLYQRLVEANIKKDTEILKEVKEHLISIRDTWKQVMIKNGLHPKNN
ncbi:flagellar export chaperone FliS [Butyrivibrio sp. NC3005]|uniref:flagellar export chaperone FliS n=1 Tax=Butyrivibrio sp. NC3005 TaxID=1280685 RepID=UPI0004135817|nr:flagellar export chaperone FliS [Butyrivibrio sp. NC3005]